VCSSAHGVCILGFSTHKVVSPVVERFASSSPVWSLFLLSLADSPCPGLPLPPCIEVAGVGVFAFCRF
jgi:hypothetical protein